MIAETGDTPGQPRVSVRENIKASRLNVALTESVSLCVQMKT